MSSTRSLDTIRAEIASCELILAGLRLEEKKALEAQAQPKAEPRARDFGLRPKAVSDRPAISTNPYGKVYITPRGGASQVQKEGIEAFLKDVLAGAYCVNGLLTSRDKRQYVLCKWTLNDRGMVFLCIDGAKLVLADMPASVEYVSDQIKVGAIRPLGVKKLKLPGADEIVLADLAPATPFASPDAPDAASDASSVAVGVTPE